MYTLLRPCLVALAASLACCGALGAAADPYRDFRDRRDRDEDVIVGFYQRYLQRSPRPDEVRHHVYAMRDSGSSLREVEANVLASPEYFRRFRGERDWLRGMITDVTDRDPVPTEVRNWMRHLDSVRGDRLATAKSFLEAVDINGERPTDRGRSRDYRDYRDR